MRNRAVILPMLGAAVLASACATAPSELPYPAFVQTGGMEAVFSAALPGTRAKPMSADTQNGRFSMLLTLPENWSWNTGGAPGKTVEIYVLKGEITLGDLTLQSGNYAYLPPGSMGLAMSTLLGAEVLYFLEDADPHAVIRTPLFMSRDVIPWQPISDDPEDAGVQIKVLRLDPGSGARTWLLRMNPGATRRWHKSTAVTEGFLLSGEHRYSECLNGEAVTADYEPGGYFRRPAGVVNGSSRAAGKEGAVWLLRSPLRGDVTYADSCP